MAINTRTTMGAKKMRCFSHGEDGHCVFECAQYKDNGMRCSRTCCGTPPILGVVNMVGTRTFTCYMGAL